MWPNVPAADTNATLNWSVMGRLSGLWPLIKRYSEQWDTGRNATTFSILILDIFRCVCEYLVRYMLKYHIIPLIAKGRVLEGRIAKHKALWAQKCLQPTNTITGFPPPPTLFLHRELSRKIPRCTSCFSCGCTNINFKISPPNWASPDLSKRHATQTSKHKIRKETFQPKCSTSFPLRLTDSPLPINFLSSLREVLRCPQPILTQTNGWALPAKLMNIELLPRVLNVTFLASSHPFYIYFLIFFSQMLNG